ncbi:MAG: pyrroloquinoline quinone biosynthesis protein PqqB [Pseudomonadota bacterium]
MSLRVSILGAAAGGGLPQWNCGCENCQLARRDEIPSQTQSSISVSNVDDAVALINASPDLRSQIAASPHLAPRGLRVSPIKAVLLTNADIDHIAGLLTLREQQPFTLFATQEIHEILNENPVFDALNPKFVTRKTVKLDVPFELVAGVTASLYAVPGKVPLYLEGDVVETQLEGEQTVGVHITDGSRSAHYIPGCATVTTDLATRLKDAELVLFDGTLWQDDEMVTAGLSQKTGARMGHMSMSGSDGSIAAFSNLDVRRKVFVHMNNTNPVLRPSSAERASAEGSGWTIGRDGMEIAL